MHVVAATRGNVWETLKTMMDLQAKYAPYKYAKDKEPMGFPINVQPLMLWSISFPEPELQKILATLKPLENDNKKQNFADHNKLPASARYLLQKSLGLDAVPLYDGKSQGFPIYRGAMDIILLGSKKDAYDKDGIEQL